jgi:hypothetical protein
MAKAAGDSTLSRRALLRRICVEETQSGAQKKDMVTGPLADLGRANLAGNLMGLETSRRSVLASAAVSTAATAIVSTSNVLAGAGAAYDPLIELGEVERRTYAAYDAASLALDRAEGAYYRQTGRWADDEPGSRILTHFGALDRADCEALAAWYETLGAIAITPARSFAGLAVKLRIIASYGETEHTTATIESALADAERLARGAL